MEEATMDLRVLAVPGRPSRLLLPQRMRGPECAPSFSPLKDVLRA
jgi:hypothetical protein